MTTATAEGDGVFTDQTAYSLSWKKVCHISFPCTRGHHLKQQGRTATVPGNPAGLWHVKGVPALATPAVPKGQTEWDGAPRAEVHLILSQATAEKG